MPYAVPINRQSLELIATNNGGLEPAIEMGPKGHPGTYFVLPDDPNEHAKIVPIEDFFDEYEFIEPESLDAFRKIVSKDEPMYELDREDLAAMVASHTSGFRFAVPEQEDYDTADAMIALMKQRIEGS